MTTLALETSTSRGSVAIVEGNKLLFNETFSAGRGHGSELFACLERALGNGLPIEQIAVGLGPGSYSGVRIAISAAMGTSLGTHASLLGLASVAAFDADEYFAVGDARRDSFYFTHVQNGEVREGPLLLVRETIETRLVQSSLRVFASESLDLPRVELCFPSAEKLAVLAVAERGILQREQLEPIYLRDPHITRPNQKQLSS